jgi:hypothetical protein
MTLRLLAVLLLVSVPATAQESTLSAVLERAGAYVSGFHQQLSGVVTEEHYVQEVHMAPTFTARVGGPPRGSTHRALSSDLLRQFQVKVDEKLAPIVKE